MAVPTDALAERMGDEWLWGWDPTPGIVSVWAEPTGRVIVWRRVPGAGQLVRESARFRPWLLLDRLDDLAHLGPRLRPHDARRDAPVVHPRAEHARERDGPQRARVEGDVTWRELDGPGALRWLVHAADLRLLTTEVLQGASRRLGRRIGHLRELGQEQVLALPPEEQYLVASGRTYFRDLAFDDLRRLQFDLETTGLDARRDRIFLVAVRDPGRTHRAAGGALEGRRGEAALIRELAERIRAVDPDVIENHNLHGFDLPFLDRRARRLGVPLDARPDPWSRPGLRAARPPGAVAVERRPTHAGACATWCRAAS